MSSALPNGWKVAHTDRELVGMPHVNATRNLYAASKTMILVFMMPALLHARVLGAAPKPARLAYTKDGQLWVLRVNGAGQPMPGTKPQWIAKLWPSTSADTIRLTCSPDCKRIAVEHTVSTEQGERYGLPSGGDYRGVWLVDARPNAVPRKIGAGESPSFSPNGKQLAFSAIPGGDGLNADKSSVVVFSLTTHRRRILHKKANSPYWSSAAREIAVVTEPAPPSNSAALLVLDAVSGRVKFHSQEAVNPEEPILSPDGRFLAVHFHLSRPLTGHTILNRRTGSSVDRDFTPARYAPGLLYGWSPDGKWLLWNWRTPDPDNDGSWGREYVGVTSFSGRVRRRIGIGTNAAFSPDGTHVLWLEPHRIRGQKQYDLLSSPLSGGNKTRIARGVDAYAVSR